jgi:hypothetical protein
MSPSQVFVEALILEEFEKIPSNCPACKPPAPEWGLNVRSFGGCSRTKRFYQLVE